MNPRMIKFGLLFGFWVLGAICGAGVVDWIWARRDGDNVRSLTINLGMLLLATAVLFAVALRKPKSGK